LIIDNPPEKIKKCAFLPIIITFLNPYSDRGCFNGCRTIDSLLAPVAKVTKIWSYIDACHSFHEMEKRTPNNIKYL